MTATEHKIKNILVYLVPSVISNFLPFVTLPIITRFLSPQEFGIAALSISSSLIIINFLGCNIDSAVQRYYFEYRKNIVHLRSLINSSLIYLFFVIALSLPAVFFLGAGLSKIIMGSEIYKYALLFSYIGNCLSILVAFYLMLYRNMERAREFSFFTTVQMLVNVSLTLLLIVVFKLGYMGIIYANFGSALCLFAMLFFRFLSEYPFSFDKKILWGNLKYGVQLLPNFFTSSVYLFFDKYLLRRIVSLSSTGIFSIAQNLSNKLFVFMTAIQSTFEPIFMKDMFDKGNDGRVSVGRNFTVFTFISLFAVLSVILFGEEIIYILAPSSYYNTINVFMILLSAIATQTYGKIVGSQLAYAKKAYLTFPITVIGLIVNVTLNLLLIPKLQALGAAFANLATISVSNYIFVKIAQRYYKIEYEKRTLLYLYLNVFISAFLLVYLRSMGAGLLIKYAVKAVSITAFLITGRQAGILTREKFKIIIGMISKKFRNTAILQQ